MAGYLCFLIPAVLLTAVRAFVLKRFTRGGSGKAASVLYFFAALLLLDLFVCFFLKIGFVPKFSFREAVRALNDDNAAVARFLLTAL